MCFVVHDGARDGAKALKVGEDDLGEPRSDIGLVAVPVSAIPKGSHALVSVGCHVAVELEALPVHCTEWRLG
jgi:hypothetical protein